MRFYEKLDPGWLHDDWSKREEGDFVAMYSGDGGWVLIDGDGPVESGQEADEIMASIAADMALARALGRRVVLEFQG